MKQISVIVPLNAYDESVKELLSASVDSYRKVNHDGVATLLFVGPKKVLESVKKDYAEDKFAYVNNENSEFASQINAAVKSVKTKYFSILEYDDVYTEKWFDNVFRQIETGDLVSLYLPLTEVIDFNVKEKGPIGYVNEAVWASSFSDEIGYLDLESLQNYMNFNVTGGVFVTDDFNDVGGLKESMKLSFWFEFLLRMLYNKKKIYVIPKVGYQHTIMRPDSLSDDYNKNMDQKEADWWMDLALKEYYFKKDRDKKYEKE